MTHDEAWAFFNELGIAFKPIDERQKEMYLSHLKEYTRSEMERAVYTIIESHQYRSFPLIAEIRRVLDKIRFDSRAEPSDEDKRTYYDGIAWCASCGGTGWILTDVPREKYTPGGSSCVASFCVCELGRKRSEGYAQYQAKKEMRKRQDYERRYENQEEGQ